MLRNSQLSTAVCALAQGSSFQTPLNTFFPQHQIESNVCSPLSITTAHRDTNLPPCVNRAPVGDLSFPKVLHACSSSGGLSGFIHQTPAAGIAAPITCDRGTCWGNGQRQSTHRLNSLLHVSPSNRTGELFFYTCPKCLSSEYKTQQESQFHWWWTGDLR